MILARSLSQLPRDPRSIVTIGTFDGVHLGHRQIVARVMEHARGRKRRSVLVTFDPHPREVVGRGPVKLLSTLDERVELLRDLGIDALLVLDFTFVFSRQTSRTFYEEYVIRGIGVDEVVVGHDHMFGRDREAGVGELIAMGKEFGFSVFEEAPYTVDGEIVSSSLIRELLLRGEVAKAARWLGRKYSIDGQVVKGDGRGATLGFPTANIRPSHDQKLIPAEGVYFVRARLNNKDHFGMSSIGVNPTFKTDGRRTIEVNIFDFAGNLYGESLRVHFVWRLRGERKFPSSKELVEQMQRDKEECLKLIEEHNSFA